MLLSFGNSPPHFARDVETIAEASEEDGVHQLADAVLLWNN